MGQERKVRIIEELPLVDKETYFFELNYLAGQLHVFALALEGVAGGRLPRVDPERHMKVLCDSAWCLVEKVRGLGRVYWSTIGRPSSETRRQISRQGVMG